MRIVQPAVFCLSILLLGGCVMPESFDEARQRSHVSGMQRHFEQKVEAGVIEMGMTREQLTDILGPPDTTTGIYTPGGYSLGYGAAPPTQFNYDEFFWVHLRAEDWEPGASADEPEGPEVLIGWGR